MFKKAFKNTIPFISGVAIGSVISLILFGVDFVVNSFYFSTILFMIFLDFCLNLYFAYRKKKK